MGLFGDLKKPQADAWGWCVGGITASGRLRSRLPISEDTLAVINEFVAGGRGFRTYRRALPATDELSRMSRGARWAGWLGIFHASKPACWKSSVLLQLRTTLLRSISTVSRRCHATSWHRKALTAAGSSVSLECNDSWPGICSVMRVTGWQLERWEFFGMWLALRGIGVADGEWWIYRTASPMRQLGASSNPAKAPSSRMGSRA